MRFGKIFSGQPRTQTGEGKSLGGNGMIEEFWRGFICGFIIGFICLRFLIAIYKLGKEEGMEKKRNEQRRKIT